MCEKLPTLHLAKQKILPLVKKQCAEGTSQVYNSTIMCHSDIQHKRINEIHIMLYSPFLIKPNQLIFCL